MSGSVPGRPIKVGNFIMTGVWCGQDSAPVWDNPQKSGHVWWILMVYPKYQLVNILCPWTGTKIRIFRGKTNRQTSQKETDFSNSKMKQLAQLTSWKTYEHQVFKHLGNLKTSPPRRLGRHFTCLVLNLKAPMSCQCETPKSKEIQEWWIVDAEWSCFNSFMMFHGNGITKRQ